MQIYKEVRKIYLKYRTVYVMKMNSLSIIVL